jgi:hypothetical protein
VSGKGKVFQSKAYSSILKNPFENFGQRGLAAVIAAYNYGSFLFE